MAYYKLRSESGRPTVSEEQSREYVRKLSALIDCKTVWTRDHKYKDEFNKFYQRVEEFFPLLTKKAKRLSFGSGCFVYVIEGRNATKNVMLMSHHDVVDGSEEWATHPYKATEKDGYLYGRGTIDS